VGHQVQGKVEGRNRRDGPQGEPGRYSHPAFRVGLQIERDHLAADPASLLDGEPEGVGGAVHLAPRHSKGLAGLGDDGGRQLFAAAPDP
jgi:hypothetical protein